MYVVLESGGRQYRAEPGQTVLVEKLPQAVGEQIELNGVLLVAGDDGVHIGRPFVDGALVRATVLRQEQGPKIRIFKYKPKKRYRRRAGHHQDYTRLRIDEIVL